MQTYDILMLAVLVGATMLGAYKGFAWQVASLASIVLSYLAAVEFRGPVSEVIGGQSPWNTLLAMLVLYIGTSAAIWLVFRVISKTIDELKLKGFDRQLGALLGAVKGVLLCVIITLFAATLLEGSSQRTVVDSHSGHYIARLLNRAHPVLPPEVHQILDPYLRRLDERLGYPFQETVGDGDAEPGQAVAPRSGWDGSGYGPVPAAVGGR